MRRILCNGCGHNFWHGITRVYRFRDLQFLRRLSAGQVAMRTSYARGGGMTPGSVWTAKKSWAKSAPSAAVIWWPSLIRCSFAGPPCALPVVKGEGPNGERDVKTHGLCDSCRDQRHVELLARVASGSSSR